jgi:small subunit ribosomal protein S8
MKDNLSDMLTRIRNGQRARLLEIPLFWPTPLLCIKVLNILEKEGVIRGFKKVLVENKEIIFVLLKYTEFQNPIITRISRVSTPGKRIFSKSKTFWKINGGKGFFVISSPIGIITDKTARFSKIGGEILCYVE